MSHRKKDRWPLVGLCIAIACMVGTLFAMVYFSAVCGYPFVSVLLVVIGLATVVCSIVSINWESIKNWVKSYVPVGVGIALTCVALSNMIQEFIAHPSVLVAILFGCICLSFTYRSLFPDNTND